MRQTFLRVAGEIVYTIGVNYGFNGDNFPAPKDVVALYKRCGIPYMRIFEPNHDILEALRGSEIILSMGMRNVDIQNLSSSQDAANSWVNTHVQPYANDVKFGWITVGNEAVPGPYASYIGQAMTNVNKAISSIGLSSIKVTTVINLNALSGSFPPSAGAFSDEALEPMKSISQYFTSSSSSAPLMVNVYPYFAHVADPEHVSFDYATFNAKDPVVDGNLKYFNSFDAMIDAVYAAMEKINAGNVPLAVAETGWPTAGNDPYTSKDNSDCYNQNLFVHVKSNGTPRKPDQLLTVFLFDMFNEDQKEAGIEQNFGLFYPNMQPVYPYFENCLT